MLFKKKTSGGFTFVEIAVVITIIGILIPVGATLAIQAYNNLRMRVEETELSDTIDRVFVDSTAGIGSASRNRVKYVNMIIDSGRKAIDFYYYKEWYPIDPVTLKPVTVSELKFDRKRTFTFESMTFDIPATINGTTLGYAPGPDPLHPLTNAKRSIGVKITRPNNDLMAFDASDAYFERMPDIDADPASLSTATSIMGTQTFLGPVNDDLSTTNVTYAYDLRPGVVPTEFGTFTIPVKYNGNDAGNIVFNKTKKTFKYVPKVGR